MISQANESGPERARSLGPAFAWFLTVIFCLAFATSALAGPPTHLRTPALDITGLDRACGAAVDSQGNVYASSPGESKIKVFDPAHVLLTTIDDVNEPCGLTVDSRGTLFVSQGATDNVVRYLPSAYPFVGKPTYGPAEAVDSSGEVRGIALDASAVLTNAKKLVGGNDSLYLAKGDRVEAHRNESQRIQVDATAGTYTLSFGGKATAPLSHDASHEAVQKALEALSTVGKGNVSVTTGNFAATDHLITFTRGLGLADVAKIEVDTSSLTGEVSHQETQGGLAATIGEGELSDATSVATHTYRIDSESIDRYLYVAEEGPDQVKVLSGPSLAGLKVRETITEAIAGKPFDFGLGGAQLAIDPGNGDPISGKCASVAEQACTAGHLLAYDDARKSVAEFEADGRFLDEIDLQEADPSFLDAQPTALAIDRSGGAGDGTIYVGDGSGPGAKLLAFGPLAIPSRTPQPSLSRSQPGAQAVATDSAGNVYVAAEALIHVYDSSGKELAVGPEGKGIPDSNTTLYGIDVDSDGNVYVLEKGGTNKEQVTYYSPSSYPPGDGTPYARHEPPVAIRVDFKAEQLIQAIAVNPANDHLFVTAGSQTLKLDSAANGSAILDDDFAPGFGGRQSIDVHGASGRVYFGKSAGLAPFGGIVVVDPTGKEVLARVSGAGSTEGRFVDNGPNPAIAVDQASGHVLAFDSPRGAVEEFDRTGAFVGRFYFPEWGEFQQTVQSGRLAIDSSGGSNDGNVYLAYDQFVAKSPDLWAFGPLNYGEPPVPITGTPSGLGTDDAVLNGSLDPRGFEVGICGFEYLTDEDYQQNLEAKAPPFAGATSQPCIESPASIGQGFGPVPVHAQLNGIGTETRYRYRLLATNKYGEKAGDAVLFGPPGANTLAAQPIFHDEATLRGEIDPAGLATSYHFEYGQVEGEYDQSTPTEQLPAGEAPVAVSAELTGLTENSTYHFRLVAENEMSAAAGADLTLTTLQREETQSCPNSPYRTGLSSKLPDCRAYELVTPPETRGAILFGGSGATASNDGWNHWLVTPRGEGAGERLSFMTGETLVGFEGSGRGDVYLSRRPPGEHPVGGWTTQVNGPTFAEAGASTHEAAIAQDQLYSLIQIHPIETFPGTLSAGSYLHSPSGFEPLGEGSLDSDLGADPRHLSSGGRHAIFSSATQLEPEAPPAGTTAIYDRDAGEPSAEVVSIKPDGSSFETGEDATFLAASEDGEAIVFEVGGELYLRRNGTETLQVAAAPNTFAGISEDGERVFFADSNSGGVPAALFLCEASGGSCAEPEATQSPTPIASNAIFVHVSADGSGVFFTSKDALTGVEENDNGESAVEGEHNLYAWDEGAVSFVAVLHPADFEGFEGLGQQALDNWTNSVIAGITNNGPGVSPTRSTPDGEALIFQSHAKLSVYENEGVGEIYRYAPGAEEGERLLCVSCSPAGTQVEEDAVLHSQPSPLAEDVHLPNVTDDGSKVFFEALDPLLPADANSVRDVYEWKASGVGGCERQGGCLALISSGQGEQDSFLYGMGADGRDVFVFTQEKLNSQGQAGSPSIYDAREGGGIPDPPAPAPCQGDACQGQGSAPPGLGSPASEAAGRESAAQPPRVICPKGKRKVIRRGKARCLKRPARHKSHRKGSRRTNGGKGGSR